MSRHHRPPTRAAAVAADPAPALASDGVAVGADATDELHRLALARRQARTGRAAAEASSPAQPTPTALTAAPVGPIVVTLPVRGMTCRSCEVRIARHVGKLPGVERVTASAARGQVTVTSSSPVPPAAIDTALRAAGYEPGRTAWLATDPRIWATAGAGLLLIATLAVLAQATGVTELAGSAGNLAQGGLVVALLLGVAAGFSSCMALVGGLVLGLSASFAARREARGDAAGSRAAQLRPAGVFVAGRVAGYAVFGAALGAIGASVTMPPQLTAVLMIAVAILMTLLGTRLTGLSPRLAGWSPTLPLGLGARLGLTSDATGAGGYSDGRAAVLGAATFFLPCGFTQAIQVYALSTGSPVVAAGLLGVFALGTAPGLLAVAGLPVLVPTAARPTLLRLAGVVVLGFALMNGIAGARLAGLSLPVFAAATAAAEPPGTIGADGVQAITTYQDADGYSPAEVVIYAGYATRWTIESSTTATCAASLWAPSVGIRARLDLGPNVFDLPPLEAGTLDYTCSMGMYGGRITIVPAPAGAQPATGTTGAGS